MLFHWLKQHFHSPYQHPKDGPNCPHCGKATERIEIGYYQGQFFCDHCPRLCRFVQPSP